MLWLLRHTDQWEEMCIVVCVRGGVVSETEKKRGLRGFERERKSRRGMVERGIDFLGLSRACN